MWASTLLHHMPPPTIVRVPPPVPARNARRATPRCTPRALAPVLSVPPPSHPLCDTAPSSRDHRRANPTVVLLGCPFHPPGRPLHSFPFLSLTLCSPRSPPAPVSVDLTSPSPPAIASLPHEEPRSMSGWQGGRGGLGGAGGHSVDVWATV
jgi:hypothetical protein